MTVKDLISQIEKMLGRQSEAYMYQIINDGLLDIANKKQQYTVSKTTDLEKKKRWYALDSDVLSIEKVEILDTTSTTSGERTTEVYDTFQGDGNLSGTITDADCSTTTITFTSAAHGLATGDRVSISGTTNFNDSALSSQTITKTGTDTFTMVRSTSSSATNETGSFTSLFIDNGLRITYKAKYSTVDAITDNLDSDIGLDTSLHPQLVCYVKSRLYEDQGNFEQAMYFRQMYENQMMKQRSRKSGVRGLAVPNL